MHAIRATLVNMGVDGRLAAFMAGIGDPAVDHPGIVILRHGGSRAPGPMLVRMLTNVLLADPAAWVRAAPGDGPPEPRMADLAAVTAPRWWWGPATDLVPSADGRHWYGGCICPIRTTPAWLGAREPVELIVVAHASCLDGRIRAVATAAVRRDTPADLPLGEVFHRAGLIAPEAAEMVGLVRTLSNHRF